jgi:hypothetical protein
MLAAVAHEMSPAGMELRAGSRLDRERWDSLRHYTQLVFVAAPTSRSVSCPLRNHANPKPEEYQQTIFCA